MMAAKAPDPDRPLDQPPMCNDGKGAVVVDGLMATTFGVATLGAASAGEGGAAAATGLIALIYGVSAGVGSSSANKCRTAVEEYTALQEKQEVEAAFMQQGGGPSITPEEVEDAPVATRTPPPTPRPIAPPVVVQPSLVPPPQPEADDEPAPPSRASRDSGDGEWTEFWKEVP